MKITAEREHEIACGHRVVGHEGKCKHLHGHNYLFRLVCESEDESLDEVGRVIDFAVIKSRLCAWIEEHWDHRLLLWQQDPLLDAVRAVDHSVCAVPFNPTAENIARHMLEIVGPETLRGTGVRLVECVVHETRKCSASASLFKPRRTDYGNL